MACRRRARRLRRFEFRSAAQFFTDEIAVEEPAGPGRPFQLAQVLLSDGGGRQSIRARRRRLRSVHLWVESRRGRLRSVPRRAEWAIRRTRRVANERKRGG